MEPCHNPWLYMHIMHLSIIILSLPQSFLLAAQAGMIICYAGTGRTASLIAKYRPSMPILALVVPQLKSLRGLSWELEGRSLARQFLIVRGK
jgi:pyruvate kinase